MSYLQMIENIDKLSVYYDIDTLDIYCEYLLNSSSKEINFANLMNLKEFIDTIDGELFMGNDAKMARYHFISEFLEARLEKGITSDKIVIKNIFDIVDERYHKIIRKEILDQHDKTSLSKKDIEFVNGMIFAQLNNIFMHKYKVPLMQLIEDVNNNEYVDKADDSITLIQSLLSELNKAKRRSKNENRFNLSDPLLLKSVLQTAYDRYTSDTQFLSTGFRGLDVMLNGGIEDGRVYNFIGGTGGFKSGLLLNLLKGIKKNNEKRIPKNPKARKTILFISQENNLWETILRIFNIFATTGSIKNYTFSEILSMLDKGGFRIVNDESEEIDIEFRYYGNEDIGVSDFQGIVEELANEGREVICIIQDYIERLRPPKRNVERRLQLSDITNQLHDYASESDISIITASQLNRDGVSIIEDMSVKKQADIGRNLGTKNISESFGMLKNIDVNIVIVVEYDATEGKYYLSFNKIKFRGADDMSIMYFLQPFEGRNSKIMLVEDSNMAKPVYRLTLNSNLSDEMVKEAQNMNKSARKRKKIEDIKITLPETETVNIAEYDKDDIFNSIQAVKKKRQYMVNDRGRITLKVI